MQEANVFMLISDMFRGVPAVYATFFAYDEVAHHSGIDRPDAFEVLRTIDAAFARLERSPLARPVLTTSSFSRTMARAWALRSSSATARRCPIWSRI